MAIGAFTMAIVKAPMVLLRSRWSDGFCSIADGDVDGSTMKWRWTAMRSFSAVQMELRWSHNPQKLQKLQAPMAKQWEFIYPFAMVSISRYFQLKGSRS